MDNKKWGPAQLATARPRNVISSAAINPKSTAETLVLQFLNRRFGVAPEVGAVIAAHAGLGPREVRS
jgi:hypothetical protein